MPSGGEWLRLYKQRHGDAFGFGKTPSRFSDPRSLPDDQRYGVIYLGSTLKVCVLEAIVRDRGDARLDDLVISAQEISETQTAKVSDLTLQLVDLRGDSRIRLGVPTDAVHAQNQTLGRAWSLAFWEHSQAPDGILYPSRLNGDLNIALFDRAIVKLPTPVVLPLLGHGDRLAEIIHDLQLSIA